MCDNISCSCEPVVSSVSSFGASAPVGAAAQSEGDSPLFSSSAISLQLRKLGHPEKSIKSMNRCQESTGGYYYSYCNCGESDGLHPMKHWCNFRTCPVCAKKRQRAVKRKYLKYLEQLPKTPLTQLYFLTISPKNYKDEKQGLAEIRKNFAKFLRQPYIKDRIRGSLYVIETKQIYEGEEIFDKYGKFLYNAKEDSWNIHIHAIIYSRRLSNQIKGKCYACNQNILKRNYLTGKYYCANHNCNSEKVTVLNDSKLVQLWHKISKNESVNIHITQQIDKETRRPSPLFTLNYMLKYISATPEDFKDAEGMARYIVATHKKKLIGATGCFLKDKPKADPPKCEACNSTINYLVSYELEPLLREAENERLNQKWIVRNNSRKKAVPPAPPKITYVTLDYYSEVTFL